MKTGFMQNNPTESLAISSIELVALVGLAEYFRTHPCFVDIFVTGETISCDGGFYADVDFDE